MSERQELIKKMIEMQKTFQEYEREHGVNQVEYYNPPEGHPLYGYAQEYRDIAMKVIDLAHQDVGSHR